MEENKQTLYNDELLDILPDGVIIFNISGEVIQLNRQALTELHVHSSVNAMMPLPTNILFKLSLNPQLHSRSATYKRNGLLIRKTAIKSSRPFQCAYYPLTP